MSTSLAWSRTLALRSSRLRGLDHVPQTVLANICVAFLGMLGSVIVARVLGPEGKGAVAAIAVWPQVIHSLLFLSINEAVTYRTAAGPDRHRTVTVAGIAAAAFAGLIAAVCCALLFPFLLGPSREPFWDVGRIYALIFLPASSLFLVLLAAEQGLARFFTYNTLRILQTVAYVLGLGVIALLGLASVRLVLAAQVAATIVIALSQLARRARPASKWPKWRDIRSEIRALLGQGARFHGLTVLLAVSTLLDRMLAVRLFSDHAVGVYTVAVSVTVVPMAAIGTGFSKVLFPRQAASSEGRLESRVARGLAWAAVFLALPALTIGFLAEPIILFVFGVEFSDSARIAPLLAGVAAVAAWRQIVEWTLKGAQLTRIAIASEVVMVALTVALAFWWGPSLGLIGLVLSLLVGNLAALFLLAVWAWARKGRVRGRPDRGTEASALGIR